MSQSFKLLKVLVQNLTKKEVVALKNKLEGYSDSSDIRRNKSKQLIRLIQKNPEITGSKTEKELYGEPNPVAFVKLVERTIDKIDEVYINFSRESMTLDSERNYYFFYLKRKLLVIQMRWLRGVEIELLSGFERIISLSLKYELYDCLIEALLAKQRLVGFHFGKTAFEKIESDIIKYEEKRRAAQRARSLFTKVASELNQTYTPKNHKNELRTVITILRRDYKNTNSATVGYYLYYLLTEWLQIHFKYDKSEIVLVKLKEIVSANASIFTKARYGEVLMNQSMNAVYNGNFKEAIEYAIEAKRYYEGSTALDVAKENEFYCRFYDSQLQKAEMIINEIYISSRSGYSPFIFSRRAYLYACVKTIQGDYKKSNQLLEEVKEIDKDKGGWNLGKRILTIINRIEDEDFESVDLKVLSLEKFLKRISKVHYVRKRDRVIFRILLKLINEGFNYSKVYRSRKRYFDLLESKDPDYGWKIKSPELIVFHDWFKRKMKQQKEGRAGRQ